MVSFSPMPWWHCPQVFPRFAAFTIERESFERKIAWTPWQDAQLAAVKVPSRTARPWKLSRSEEHTSERQSRRDLACRLQLEKKKKKKKKKMKQKNKKKNEDKRKSENTEK